MNAVSVRRGDWCRVIAPACHRIHDNGKCDQGTEYDCRILQFERFLTSIERAEGWLR
jgi:hypothetical protein